jgi:hypothetical protein
MAASRRLPVDAADLVRSLVPIALLSVAAAAPPARIAVLIVLAAGAAIAVQRDAPVRWTWAGAVPVAVNLFWGAFAHRSRPSISEIARIRRHPSRRGARSRPS